MKITLLLFKPSGSQKEIPLKIPVAIVGRSGQCHIQLIDTRVSRRHCVLAVSGGRLRVTDLDSSTGTYVNNRRVRRATLKDGDMLSVGRFRLKVVMTGAPEDLPSPISAGTGAGVAPGRLEPRREAIAQSADQTGGPASPRTEDSPAGQYAAETQQPIHTERLDPAAGHGDSDEAEEAMEHATAPAGEEPGKKRQSVQTRSTAIVRAWIRVRAWLRATLRMLRRCCCWRSRSGLMASCTLRPMPKSASPWQTPAAISGTT